MTENTEQVFRRRVDILKNKIWSKADLEGRQADVVLQALAEVAAEVTTACVEPDDIPGTIESVAEVLYTSVGIGNETSN